MSTILYWRNWVRLRKTQASGPGARFEPITGSFEDRQHNSKTM